MILNLKVVYGCSHITKAELSSCNTDQTDHTVSDIHYLANHRKRLPTSALHPERNHTGRNHTAMLINIHFLKI